MTLPEVPQNSTQPGKVSPALLYMQAQREVEGGLDMPVRERYRELMTDAGHLVPREPGDDPNLPCGWPHA